MTFSIIPSRYGWTEQLKTDTMNAVNILMLQKKIHPDTNYSLELDEGKPVVLMWMDGADGPCAVAKADPVDIITAAGKLNLVRGTSDDL